MRKAVKIGLIMCLVIPSSLWGQAGTMQTLQEVNSGTDFRIGFYNYSDENYASTNGVNAVRITFTSLTVDQLYYLFIRTATLAAPTTYTYTSLFPFHVGSSANSLTYQSASHTFTASATTMYVEFATTELDDHISGDATSRFTAGVATSNSGSAGTYATNAQGGGAGFIYDITRPTVTAVSPAYAGGGSASTITLTGTGFDGDNGTNEQIQFGSTKFEDDGSGITIASSTSATFSSPTTGDDSGSLYFTDAAGNVSAAGPTFRLDNTSPGVTSISVGVVKEDATAILTGTGFTASGSATGINTFKIGSTTLGTSYWTVNSATQITITGSSADITSAAITVTDSAGNSGTDSGVTLAFDNTKPTVSSVQVNSVDVTIVKGGKTVVIGGSGFTTNGTPSVTIGGTGAGTLFTVSSTASTAINILIGASGNTAAGTSPQVVVTDAAGNASTDAVYLDVDNTHPTVSSVGTRYIKSAGTSLITGTGFNDDGGNADSVIVGSKDLATAQTTGLGGSFSEVGSTTLTITAGASSNGECTDCNVIVVDKAGNRSEETGKLLTIDNTAPTVTGLNGSAATTQVIVKSGDTFTIDGTGFGYSTGAPTDDSINDDGVTIGGSVPTGMTWNVGSNTQITATASSGEVADGVVVVTDASENASTSTSYKVTIDNSAPSGLSISAKSTNTDQTATVFKKDDEFYITSGNADLVNSGFTAGAGTADPTVYIGSTDMSTYATVTTNSSSQITVTITTTNTSNIQGALTVTDKAGNQSSSIKTIYIDNNVPTISSVTNPVIGNCGACTTTATVSTTTTGGGAPGYVTGSVTSTTVSIAGSPAGMTYSVTGDAALTITAGGGEVEDALITVTDPAGNPSVDGSSAVDHITIDNTAPTVTSLSDSSIKNAATTTITGSGFFTQINGTDDGTGVKVYIGGSEISGTSISVGSDTEITLTAGSTEASGKLTVVDRAGNESSTGAQMRIDNTAPTLTAVSVGSIKSGGTTVLTGSDFTVGGNAPTLTIGGSVPTGMSFAVDGDGQITITGGSGEVTDGKIVVTDQAGNASTDNVYLQIDNTAPTVSSVSNSVIGACTTCTQTTVLTGTGFTIGSYSVQAKQVNVGGSLPTGLTHTVGSATSITITAGSGEVTSGTVTVVDSAGNETGSSTVSLTIDNSAPTVTAISDRWIKSGETTTITGTGFTTNGNASKITVAGTDLVTAVSGGGLGGSFTVSSDTEITITGGAGEVTRGSVVVYDFVGNPSTATSIKLSIDNTAPNTPTLDMHYWDDTGYSNSDNLTYDTDADFYVSNVVAGDSITVLLGATPVMASVASGGSATSNRSHSWYPNGITQDQEIAGQPEEITGGDGTYTFSVTATDSAGNTSTAGTLTYTLDTTAPATPVLEYFSSGATGDESSTDKITNDNTPTLKVSNVIVANGVRAHYYYKRTSTSWWTGSDFDLDKDTVDTNPLFVTILDVLADSSDTDGDEASARLWKWVLNVAHVDSAGNTAWDTWNYDFQIDTKAPQATLSYSTVNAITGLTEDPDSLTRYEDGTLTITAVFKDSDGLADGMNNTVPPTISIDLPETTADDITDAIMTPDASNDNIWTYAFEPPDGIDGTATVTVDGTDNAGNEVVTASTVGTNVMVFDNTDPIDFTMGKVTPMGENPKVGYFNYKTDSLSAIVPMDASDASLGSGQVKLTMQIFGNDASKTQVDTTIKITNYSQPLTIFTKKDSIRRNFSKTAGPPWAGETLVEGSKLLTMAEIFDKAGNSTLGFASVDTMIIDTIPPVKGAKFTTGNVVANDTIISTDSVKVTWNSFFEDTLKGETGINRYEWALEDEIGPAEANIMPFTSVSTDTSAAVRDTLTHNIRYNVLVRAVDEAGNNSDTLSLRTQDGNGFLRLNTAPALATVDSQNVDEDKQFSYLFTATEPDTTTLLGDTIHFTILDTGIVGATNKPTIDEYTGLLTWNTPVQKDSGSYTIKIRAEDEWLIPGGTTNMADTISFVLTVNSVNDTPVVTAASDVSFLEDVMNGDTLTLTPLVTDVDDNDTTQIKWSAVVDPDVNVYPSYPTVFFYDPGATIEQRAAIRRFITGDDETSLKGPTQQGGSFSGGPAEKLRVVIDTTQTLTRAFFVADSNYYVTQRKVTLIATDRYGASDSTSLVVTISAINDKPRLTAISETTMWEGDTLKMVIAATDIDDDTVNFKVIPDSASRLDVTVTDSLLTVISKALPNKTNNSRWAKSTKVLVVASDPDTSDSTTFTLKVQRLPRPAPWLYLGENATFARFYEMMIVDTAEKALGVDLTINPIGAQVKFDSLGSYTWVANYEFDTTATFDYLIKARARHGDTTVTRSSQFALARAKEDWTASSSDGDFRVIGKRGAVTYDKPFAIVDSLLFPVGGRDGGLYRMGHPMVVFENPVMVSLPVDPKRHPDDQAIHRRGRSGVWEELPSLTKGDEILAWTDEMGYFKRGEKTLIVPEETGIGNNYPNPFNSETRIRFDVGLMGGLNQRIDVGVYNLLGQRVKTLHHGPIGIGQHELSWHGLNDRGVPVSSGIYVLRMVSDSGMSQSKKMMLMR